MNRKRVIAGICLAVFIITTVFFVLSHSLLGLSHKVHIYHQETYETINSMVNLSWYMLIAAIVILASLIVFCLLNKGCRKLAVLPLLMAIMLGCFGPILGSKASKTETIVLINAQVIQINNNTVTVQPNQTNAVNEQVKLYVTPAESELFELHEHYGSITYRSLGDEAKTGYLLALSQ